MRLIDNHAHIFPFLGGASGYGSAAEHLAVLQRAFAFSSHPARRVEDGAEVSALLLWDPARPGPAGQLEVKFQVGEHGRVEWECDGVRYYRQFLSPLMREMTAPPELVIALMNDAGVSTAILQNDRNYGRLNAYIAEAVRRFPGRFIGLAQVDEGRAVEDQQLASVERAAADGLRGLYFKLQGLSSSGFSEDPYGPRYEPLWQAVKRLGWPVYWDISPIPGAGREDYVQQLQGWCGWLKRHPGIRCVLPNGLSTQFLETNGRFRMPDWLTGPLVEHEVLVELSLPIRWGGRWDYPFVEALPILEKHLTALGPKRLVWGSDIPNVERFCTYRQTITHLTRHWPGVTEADLSSIMGGNLAQLFGLED